MPTQRPPKPVTKFTPARLTLLLQALREANTRNAACARAGITFETFNQWSKDEEKLLPAALTLPEIIEGQGSVEYPEGMPFIEAVEQAEGEAEDGLVSRIRKAALDSAKVTEHYDRNGQLMRRIEEYDWRAGAWLLEHNPMSRKKWIAPKVAEVSGPDGGPIKTDGRASVSFEPDAAYLAALGKAVAEDGEEDDKPES